MTIHKSQISISLSVRKILIIICITTALLVVLEGISRIILSRVYNRKFDSSLIEERKYGSSSGLKPNASGMVWGKPFHTDEMGGRRQTKNKQGKPKLLVIGDSVTEGVGVDDSATFANLINERLDSFDLRNISLIGWSVDDYRNAIEAIITQDNDREIKKVYLFYCLNDIYGPASMKDLPVMANKGTLGTINALLQGKYATYKLIKLCMYQNNDKYYQYDKALYRDSARLNSTIHTLFLISELCKENNVALEVFMVPYRSQFHSHDNQPQQILGSLFRIAGISYLDLLPLMRETNQPDRLYLFADEIHLSAAGHRAVADAIFHK